MYSNNAILGRGYFVLELLVGNRKLTLRDGQRRVQTANEETAWSLNTEKHNGETDQTLFENWKIYVDNFRGLWRGQPHDYYG